MSLIEREKLLEHLNACLAESDGETPITDAVLVAIRCAVEQMPEVDAVPVVHGSWAYNGIKDSALSGCSVCGFPCEAYSFKYCPNCGAKMDEERRADNGT